MTILIVEDDEAITYVLKEYFKETNRRCLSSQTVERTLRVLAGLCPRTILLDWVLTDGDATPIVIRLKQNGDHKGCNVVLMSASEQIEKLSEKHQIPRVLKKPFDFDDLERVIN